MRRIFAAMVAGLTFTGCASNFPTGDITAIIGARDAFWVTTQAASYDVYGGYGSSCAHSGAHVNFDLGDSKVIYAALDAVVADVQLCEISGTNDKYVVTLAVAMKGPTPVYLEYEFEPTGGKRCSAAEQPEDYFDKWVFVEKGDRIKKGDRISLFTAQGAGAHVHLSLKADGANVCPEIFSAATFSDASKVGAGLNTSSCGGNPISSGTFCHALTPSENPSQVFQ